MTHWMVEEKNQQRLLLLLIVALVEVTARLLVPVRAVGAVCVLCGAVGALTVVVGAVGGEREASFWRESLHTPPMRFSLPLFHTTRVGGLSHTREACDRCLYMLWGTPATVAARMVEK